VVSGVRDDRWTRRYGPWALVAGASEGLGEAFAHGLARRGVNLVLVARGRPKLDAVADAVRTAHGVEVVVGTVDLGAPDVLDRLAPLVDGRDLGLLVYNACASHIGEVLALTEAQREATLDVNVRGVVRLTTWLAPRLVARGRGGLLLMSSMSGFQGAAMVGLYAATKAFDTVFGETLWEELGPRGVDVLVCAAGATRTPAFLAVTPKARQGDALPMEPGPVAEEALEALGRGGPTLVPGRTNRLARVLLGRVLSRRAAVRFISRSTRRMYEGTT
jgi:short-subunit dehydrogenase